MVSIVATERIAHETQRTEYSRRDCKRKGKRTTRCRGVTNTSTEQHKASQTMPEDLDSWRDQNGQATTVAFTPSTYLVLPFCVCMQHAFGFMDASGRKSDLLKTKKNRKKRIK